jgi:hypothetical protein
VRERFTGDAKTNAPAIAAADTPRKMRLRGPAEAAPGRSNMIAFSEIYMVVIESASEAKASETPSAMEAATPQTNALEMIKPNNSPMPQPVRQCSVALAEILLKDPSETRITSRRVNVRFVYPNMGTLRSVLGFHPEHVPRLWAVREASACIRVIMICRVFRRSGLIR